MRTLELLLFAACVTSTAAQRLNHRYAVSARAETDVGEPLVLSSFLPHNASAAKAAAQVTLPGWDKPRFESATVET